jgi:hypothetical protein
MRKNEEPILQELIENIVVYEEELQQPHMEDVPNVEAPEGLKRARKSAIPDDYKVYICKEIQMEGDPTSFEEVMRTARSQKWLETMRDEMRSMSTNKVWNLEDIPKGAKTVGCKWVYETKYGSKGNVKRYKAQLVVKGFTQREGIDYNEVFSLVSCKDFFRIIIALVARYDLELH